MAGASGAEEQAEAVHHHDYGAAFVADDAEGEGMRLRSQR